MEFKIAIFLTLVVGASAGPVRAGTDTCSQTCTGSTKFSYIPGSSYQFKYDVETKTGVVGASDDFATIGITAIAVVEVHSKCEMVLEVRDVTIQAYDMRQYTDQDEKKTFANSLQKYPLRFSFQDGVVESVCPNPNDAIWAVNIKKGVLSAFQMSLDSLGTNFKGKESDVTGRCDTEYVVAQRGWKSITLKKTKDLNSCSNRHSFHTALQSSPFKLSSGLKSLPLLKGTHTCDHEVTAKGVLRTAVCHEMHVLQPFSKENNGAATETTQKLQYFRTVSGLSTEQAVGGESESLYFRHDEDEEDQSEKAKQSLMLLKEICVDTVDHVSAETPRQFANLVYSLKKLDARNLMRVFNQAHKDDFCKNNEERVRKFTMDSFPMIGTTASVEVMKDLISNNFVKGQQADIWLASLAFIDQPNTHMIKEVLTLLGLKTLESRVILPLSSLVNSYCRVNPQCADVDEVMDFIRILQNNLQDECNVNQDNFRTVMMTLRGLGNTGHAERAVPSLYKCVFNENNPMDIRVSAVEAFRKLSCGADRNNLMALYRNADHDSELRIAAYLSVMKCPTPDIISQVRQTLVDEEVNQVGSFVWSHLSNLIESSDPENRYVQQLLSDNVLEKEFDLSKLKFSRNYEASTFIDRFNTGAKVDANLVWSTKSFVPRSANLNLTFDMFGEKFNLFELGGRVEGLEQLLESYFGPVGHYSNKEEMGNDIPEYKPKLASISPSKLKTIKNQAKTQQDKLRGAMYMRMLGNEVTYSMFGHDNGRDDGNAGSEMFNFMKKLMSSEPQKMSATKSFMFVDSRYVVPTMAGLPLTLAINGTATVALNMETQTNLKKPASNVLIEGKIEPSGAVEVDSSMSVDAMVTRAGLKMLSTLHTSTGASASVGLTDMSALDFKFDFTKEKSEILNVKTDIFMMYNDALKKQKINQYNRYDSQVCSGKRLSEITGVELCASLSAPNASHVTSAPYFPLTGPVSINIDLYKKDLPQGYIVEAKVIKNPVQTLFRLLTDTPGSTTKRAIGLDIVQAKSTLNMNLNSPWKQATFTGELRNSAKIKGLLGKLDIDSGSQIYNLDAKIIVERTKNRLTYTPTISLEIPDVKNVQLTGSMNYILEKSFEADLLITGATDDPITIQSSLMNTDKRVGGTMKLSYKKDEAYEAKAVIQKKIIGKRYSYSPDMFVKTPEKTLVTVEGDILYIENKNLKVKLKMEQLTKVPITLSLDLTHLKTSGKRKSERHFGRCVINGPRVSSNLMFSTDNRAGKNIIQKLRWNYKFGKRYQDTITFNNKIKLNENKWKNIVKVTSTLKSVKNKDYEADFAANFIQTKSSTNVNANLKYGLDKKNKKTKDRLDISLQTTHRLAGKKKTVDYVVGLQFPPKSVDVNVKGSHTHNDNTVTEEVTVRYHPTREVSFNLRLHNKTAAFINYAAELTIGLPEQRQMSFAVGVGKESESKYISNLEFEIIKGRRTRIDSLLKIMSDRMFEVEVGLQLPDLDPLRVIGSFNKNDNGFTALSSFKRGEKLYSISIDYMLEGDRAIKIDFDLIIPSRHIKVILDRYKSRSTDTGMVDIQWDADKDMDARFMLNVTYDFKGWDDFELSTTLLYPSRTIDFSMKHSANARYITSVELSWSPKDKMEAKMIFRDDIIDGSKRTELSVSFNSPFKKYESLGLSVSLIRDDHQYQTKSSITWARKKKVLVSLTSKVPISVKSIDVSGTITTPFDDYKLMTAKVTHRLLNKGLDSSLLVEWGRERISMTVNGLLDISRNTRNFTSKVDIRTPFEGYRIFLLNGEHFDDSVKFHSKLASEATLTSEQNNAHIYLIEMNVENSKRKLFHKGTLQVTYPGDDITTTWLLNSQMRKTELLFDMVPMRKNRIKIHFVETHQMAVERKISSKFEILVPSTILQTLVVRFDHDDRSGYLKNDIAITKDNLDIFTTSVEYSQIYGSVSMDAKVTCIKMDDITVKLTTAHSISPYRGSFEVKWSKRASVKASSRLHFDKFGTYDGTFELNLPLQALPRLMVSTRRQRQGLNWETNSAVEYAPRQKINLNTVYRFDHIKMTTIRLTTPFPQFSKAVVAFNVDGTFVDLKGDASLEVQPYLQKTSAQVTWTYYHGTKVSGTFDLQTPFPQYPYMKAKIDSNVLGVSRLSKVEVEYLPTQVIKVVADHRYTSRNTIEGTVKVTSPFTKNQQVTAGFTHVGDRTDFKTSAKITCECWSKEVYADTAFSSKDALISTFNMTSPFAGYELVKWNFKHRGTPDDFHTVAEYRTRDDKLSIENKFKMTDSIEGQFTLLTPFKEFTRSHLQFTHTGELPNTVSHGELAFNEQQVTADATLSHTPSKSDLNVVVTTPFKRYERISSVITKSGSLNDFTALAEYKYTQTWRADMRHKYDGFNVESGFTLASPYFQDDVQYSYSQTGSPLNFTSNFKYTMGSIYETTGETEFLFDMPNLKAETTYTTRINEDIRVNSFVLRHLQKIDTPRIVDINSKFLAQVQSKRAGLDFVYKHNFNGLDTQPEGDIVARYENIKQSLSVKVVAEIPVEGLKYNKLYYDVDTKGMDYKAVGGFETPLLEDITYFATREGTLNPISLRTFEKTTYGDQEITAESHYKKGLYTYKVTTPFEGYESSSIIVTYGGNAMDAGLKESKQLKDASATINVDIISTALSSPVKVSLENSRTLDDSIGVENYNIEEMMNKMIIVYDDKNYISETLYKKGHLTWNTDLPCLDQYAKSSLEVSYSGPFKYSLDMSNSGFEEPIKTSMEYALNTGYGSSYLKWKLSSSFDVASRLELDSSIDVSKHTLKPDITLIWNNEKREKQTIQVTGNTNLNIVDAANVDFGGSLKIKSPFVDIKEFEVSFEESHKSAPIRAKSSALIQLNSHKYLDIEADCNSLDKFAGNVKFNAPRKMEYSFSSENEGESVKVDLLADWNKDVKQSSFRLSFGLADTGDSQTENKEFFLKVKSPTKSIGINHNLVRSTMSIGSDGKVSWSDDKEDVATYQLKWQQNEKRRSTSHTADLKLTIPQRSVELGAVYTDKMGRYTADGSIKWDADKNPDKRVEVNVVLAPEAANHLAQINVSMPNLNKEISLTSETVINNGPRLVDGSVKLVYSPESDKAVKVQYKVEDLKAEASLSHVDTKTHIDVISSLDINERTSKAQIEVQYMKNSAAKRNLQMSAEIDRLRREIKMEMSTADQSATISGQMTDQSPYELQVQGSRNGKPGWKTVWNIDSLQRSLDASLSYDQLKKKIMTQAMFINDTSFTSKTQRQSDSSVVEEGFIQGDLQGRLLHARITWRPQLVKDVMTVGAETLKGITDEVGSVMEDGLKEVGDEMVYKFRTISNGISEELLPLRDSLNAELSGITQEVRSARRNLKKMYRNNDLYMKTINEMCEGSIKEIMKQYDISMARMTTLYADAQQYITDLTEKIDTYPLQEKYTACINKIKQVLEEGQKMVIEELDRLLEELTTTLNQMSSAYKDVVTDIRADVDQYLNALVEEFALTPYTEEVQRLYNELVEKYKDRLDLPDVHELLNNLRQLLADTMKKSSLKEKYTALYEKSQELLDIEFPDILQRDDIREIQESLKQLYKQISVIYQYTRMDISATEMLDLAVNRLKKELLQDFNQLPLGLLEMHKSKFTTFDLQNGEVEFDLYLPIPVKNFEEVMQMTVKKYIGKLRQLQEKYFPRRDICLWDLYYSLPPVQWSLKKDWLVPPYDVYGTVSGHQHYTTFDGSHFDLAGLCSYILATDLTDDKFTVIQSYGGTLRKAYRDSLVVMVMGKMVELNSDYLVKVDGQPVEMPYRSPGLDIERRGDKIFLRTRLGLDVTSDFTNDYHIIKLSGWYYGKVGGLLGSYDNEPNNDQMTPSRQVEQRDAKFLQSWEVDDSCRSQRNLANNQVRESDEICEAMFDKTSSPLRPCFLQVSPANFQQQCDRNPEKLCHRAELYREMCARNGISLNLPKMCMKCETVDGDPYTSDKAVKFDTQTSQDVVFVVEERPCNRDMANKLKDVIYKLEQTLADSAVSNNQYSLVGYDGSKQVSHTMEGQLFNDNKKFAMGLENLRFDSRGEQMFGGRTDPERAIRYAIDLPYRAGVMKTIVLVSCSQCEENLPETGLTWELQQRGITLHMLQLSGFQLKTNKSPKSQIFGMDGNKLYAGPREKTEAYEQFLLPEDHCSRLVLNTNGSIFDGSQMLKNNVRWERSFIREFSSRVGRTKPECQVCSCEIGSTGSPVSVCRACDIKPVTFNVIPKFVNVATDYKNMIASKVFGYQQS